MSAEDDILNSNFALVDFYNSWCGPCKALSPVMDEIANKYRDNLKVIKINTYEQTEIARKYGIQSVPTLLFMKKGEIVERMTSLQNKKSLIEKIEKHLFN